MTSHSWHISDQNLDHNKHLFLVLASKQSCLLYLPYWSNQKRPSTSAHLHIYLLVCIHSHVTNCLPSHYSESAVHAPFHWTTRFHLLSSIQGHCSIVVHFLPCIFNVLHPSVAFSSAYKHHFLQKQQILTLVFPNYYSISLLPFSARLIEELHIFTVFNSSGSTHWTHSAILQHSIQNTHQCHQ